MQDFRERKLITDPQKAFHFTDLQRLKPTRANDPYDYQAGWGNRHQSEVIPGTLPVAQNNPQETRFGLYTEGITYSAFAAPRAHNFSTYMYRCRPAAAHSMYRYALFNTNAKDFQMATSQLSQSQTSKTASFPSIIRSILYQSRPNGDHSHYQRMAKRSTSLMGCTLFVVVEIRTSEKVLLYTFT
jgi:homogentisate 1,2-dioxygenase